MDVKSLNPPVGLKLGGSPELAEIAASIVSTLSAPAASITLSWRRSDGWKRETAVAGRLPKGDVNHDTPFDLASVTKPIVALTAAELARQSKLKLSDPVAKWLPELRPLGVGSTTIEQLLSHRSGLPGHRILFDTLLQRRAILRSSMLARTAGSLRELPPARLQQVQGAVYSDLGYLLIGAILERALSTPLDGLVDSTLTSRLDVPIASSRQWYRRHANFRDIVAPTETVAWRGGTLRGVVHDENAWAWGGYGMAGHAGLFGASPGLAMLGESVIDALAGRPSVVSRFASLVCTGIREGGSLRAGFDGITEGRSSAGTRISRAAFGHLGFTGTSLWCDPDNQLVFVILTNRVHPTRNNTRLPSNRAQLHDWLFEWAKKRVNRE